MVTIATARARRIVVSIAAAIALLCGSVVAAQPAQALSFSTTQLSTMAQKVFSLLNSERKLHGLRALTWSIRLTTSAHRHNLKMAAANTMSHQLPGEASLGDRIRAANYNWSACGENIGWNSDATTTGVLYLQKIMYGEVAPNDGHRRIILSSTYHNVGIDVYYDATHRKMWLTEDFGRLMGS
jgi:uncharacterized protein YkwD